MSYVTSQMFHDPTTMSAYISLMQIQPQDILSTTADGGCYTLVYLVHVR